jgi:hypothetical protein
VAVRQLRIVPPEPLPEGATEVTPEAPAGTAPTPGDIADAGPVTAPPSTAATADTSTASTP